ncbi:MAG: hypothetical protein HY518_01590 [Candidatus Aenigmarchaeota archaeon]|nr:hypothetical protein [Candidatus Aenigmarchaeota archaeon]
MHMKTGRKSGQSAMEYLMTYGWAILIIIIVAAALFALGVFNPATFTGKRATGFPNVGLPTDWQYAGDDFNITLKNSLGSPINISDVTAVTSTSNCGTVDSINTTGPFPPPLPLNLIVGSGQTATFGFGDNCPSLSAGTAYSLTVTVSYIQQGGTFPITDRGTVTGTAT